MNSNSCPGICLTQYKTDKGILPSKLNTENFVLLSVFGDDVFEYQFVDFETKFAESLL